MAFVKPNKTYEGVDLSFSGTWLSLSAPFRAQAPDMRRATYLSALVMDELLRLF